MGVVTGGGGAAFNGGTITDALQVEPTDNTSDPLFTVRAPAGFDANSSGVLLQLLGEDGQYAASLTDSQVVFRAGTGRGNELMLLLSRDDTDKALAFGTAFGVAVTSDTGAFELDSELGVRQFYASGSLGIVTAVHAAPASSDLNAGECALWFDQTNGAAKLMLKGKTANGTVVTAAIALA